MDPLFAENANTVAAQAMVDLLQTGLSGGITLLKSVAFQRRIMVVGARACLNTVASGLSIMSDRASGPAWPDLVVGVVGLSVIVPMVHVVTSSSLDETWESMSAALRLTVSDSVRFCLLADVLPALVLRALA